MHPTNPTQSILAESWSSISQEYEKVLVPRFAPWTKNALDALQVAASKDMKCTPGGTKALVLCCGPGQELMPIAKMLGPSSRVLGTDLAAGMIGFARKRIAEECKEGANAEYEKCITAEVADAQNPPGGPFHIVFSAFGLQQLPKPISAVEAWLKLLEPGGLCVFIYWPPSPPKIGEDVGPFEVWGDLVQKKLGKQKKEDPWDETLGDAIIAAGGEILEDRFINHEICWKDANALFDGMSRAGPWHAMRLRRGDEFVDQLGKELIAQYPATSTPLCHQFTARMFVVRRASNQSSKM